MRIMKSSQPLRDPEVLALRDKLRAGELTAGAAGGVDVRQAVARILSDVEQRGDAALIDWERKLDRVELTPEALRVPAEAVECAHAGADPGFLGLVRRVRDNIRAYQEHIRIQAPPPLVRGGRELSVRYTPIERVAVYVPGMRALYPSSFLMTIVPAQVAGVPEIVVASPPLSDGDIDPVVLALAGELGIREVYRLGGAVAVAGTAFGTETIPAVRKIVGPGNAFVTEAKRQVFGRVGIDSTAGPSEVLIVADDTAEPAWVAADLLAQAEHDPASAILVTPSADLAEKVAAEVERQLPELDRAEATRACLDAYGAIIVVDDLAAACAVANDFAAEHLQIITTNDDAALMKIPNAGAAFLGSHSPVPLGDYYAGPSHVLPTGGTGKFFGPLSCNEFLTASSVIRYDAAALAEDTEDTARFAEREGLTAHARAVRVRGEKKS